MKSFLIFALMALAIIGASAREYAIVDFVAEQGVVDATIIVNSVPPETTFTDSLGMFHYPIVDYVPGDANGNGVFNGLDITYLVNYLKGGPAPPDTINCGDIGLLLAAADANGNCSVNGLVSCV